MKIRTEHLGCAAVAVVLVLALVKMAAGMAPLAVMMRPMTIGMTVISG